jgi:hypothetical protein
MFVSSDHEDASATVAALDESLGFAAIEVGNIAGGRPADSGASTPGISESRQIPAVGSAEKCPIRVAGDKPFEPWFLFLLCITT